MPASAPIEIRRLEGDALRAQLDGLAAVLADCVGGGASVSYMDYLMTTGLYQLRPPLPYVPGTDAAGIVLACGDQVTRFRVGDRVCCGNWFGGFAEFDHWGSMDVNQLDRRRILNIPIYTAMDEQTICIHQNHDHSDLPTHVRSPRIMEKAMANLPRYNTPDEARLGHI